MPFESNKAFLKAALGYFFLVILSQNYQLVAQTITIKKIGIQDGLSSEGVRAIHEDKYGYKWISTSHGLNKYDGYSFEIFRYNPQDSFSIRANSQGEIYEDTQANIWVALDVGGISKLDRATGKFRYFCYDCSDLSLPNNFVTNVFFDSKQRSWISSNSMINEVDFEKGTYSPVQVEGKDNIHISAITESQNGAILLSAQEGIFMLDEDDYVFKEVKQEGVDPLNTTFILNRADGSLIAKTEEDGLFSLNDSIEYFEKIPSPTPSLNILNNLFETEGKLLASVDGKGLFELGSEGWHLKDFEGFNNDDFWFAELIAEQKKALIITRDYIVYLIDLENEKATFIHDFEHPINTYSFNASDGVLWIGSQVTGLYKITIQEQHFKNFLVDPGKVGDNDFINITNAISSFNEESIFFASGEGLIEYNLNTDKAETILRYDQEGVNFQINSIEPLGKKLFLGATNGVYVFEPQDKTLNRLKGFSIKQSFIDLAFDNEGYLWVLSKYNLFRYELSSGNTISINSLDNAPEALKSIDNRSLFLDSKKNVWVGKVISGLFRIVEQKEGFSIDQFNYTGIRDVQYQAQTVNTIFEDSEGNLWIGGFSSGLLRLDRDTETWLNMTPKGAKPIPNIQGILEAEDGSIWLSAIDGLHKYNPKTGKFRRFGFEDGLNSVSFQLQSAHSVGNQMFFGSRDALTHFNPSLVKEPLEDSDILIERIRLFDSELKEDKPIQEVSELSFSYDRNFIGFDFLSINYLQSEKLFYSYMLEGVDETWVNNGKSRSVNYSNLAPGEYAFKVRAGINVGDWSSKEATILINIKAPFWKMWWFYLLIVLFFVAVLYGLHLLRLKRKLHKIKVMEAVRKKAAADFHDEMGNKLTRIALFSEVLERKLNGSYPETTEYLDKIKSNSRSLNNSMRDFLWALDPKKDTAYDLATVLKDFGEELFDKTPMALSVEQIPGTLHEITLNMDWKRHLVMTFKEAMHNVLKHSEARNVFLHFNLKEDQFSICLRDDGGGFDLEKASKGYGLRNMKLRITEVGGELKIESSKSVGTKVTFVGQPHIGEKI